MLFNARKQAPPTMTLEGVLGPNTRLDDAAGMSVESPQSVCVLSDGRLLFSSGKAVLVMEKWGEQPQLWCAFDRPVTALCSSRAGTIGIGLADGGFAVRDNTGQVTDAWVLPAGLASATGCIFRSEEEIVIVDCGYRADQDILSLAPWDEKAKGQIMAISRTGAPRTLARELHCPMGISHDRAGELIVTQLERACIVDMSGKVRQSGYPAYLGGIRKTDSGFFISCLARRDPLIEFIRTEKDFVAEMKANIEPHHWISPRTNPEFSHDFPIELGATRLFGEIKPWAPSFSYGLVIETDENLVPTGSAHSRANGTRHAISDAVGWNGDTIAVSKASQELLCISSGSDAA